MVRVLSTAKYGAYGQVFSIHLQVNNADGKHIVGTPNLSFYLSKTNNDFKFELFF